MYYGKCLFCKEKVFSDKNCEWVQRHGMNSKKGEKVYFHRSCYMKTTIGYHNKAERIKND